jgi:hypothetical protein
MTARIDALADEVRSRPIRSHARAREADAFAPAVCGLARPWPGGRIGPELRYVDAIQAP